MRTPYVSIIPWITAAMILGASCGDDPSGPEAEACFALAHAAAQAAERCGEDYQQNYDAFIHTATGGGDCGDVRSVRDSDALYNECIPSLHTIECSDLYSANLDSSCYSQLHI